MFFNLILYYKPTDDIIISIVNAWLLELNSGCFQIMLERICQISIIIIIIYMAMKNSKMNISLTVDANQLNYTHNKIGKVPY